jgi:hypothetical protein
MASLYTPLFPVLTKMTELSYKRFYTPISSQVVRYPTLQEEENLGYRSPCLLSLLLYSTPARAELLFITGNRRSYIPLASHSFVFSVYFFYPLKLVISHLILIPLLLVVTSCGLLLCGMQYY